MNDGFDSFKHGVSQQLTQNSTNDTNYMLYICTALLVGIFVYSIWPSARQSKNKEKKKSLNFQNFYDFNVWILKNFNYKNKKSLIISLIKEGIYDLIQILEWESFDLISRNFKEPSLTSFTQIISKRRATCIKKIRQTNHKELRKLINEMRVFTLDENTILMLGSSRDQSKFLGMINSFSELHTQVFDVSKSGELIKTLRGTYMKIVFLEQRFIAPK